MLSTKVIYAIEVLVELANANPNRMGKRVVRRSDIEKRCDMDKTVSACVFNTLTKYKYISRSTTGYSPVKSLHNVTLYEIIAPFHGGYHRRVDGHAVLSGQLPPESGLRQTGCVRKRTEVGTGVTVQEDQNRRFGSGAGSILETVK